MNRKQLLNGNEAIAWGAAAAGVNYFSHYPGSPVNFVEPSLKKIAQEYHLDIKFNDAINEHIASLGAAGASYCGARSMVVMKHVGLNIAADPLNYIGYTGVKGGMVIVVGTDPGANSSTGEEDVHWYVPQFNFPLFEPTSISEIFEFTQKAFELSEEFQIPVLLFIPGRICHNSDMISLPELSKNDLAKVFEFEQDKDRYINVGKRAVTNHRKLVEKINHIGSKNKYYQNYFNNQAKTGIVTRGITFGHAYESILQLNLSEKLDLLHAEMIYPLGKEKILEFSKGKEELIFIEDQDGFLEYLVKMNCFNEIEARVEGKSVFPAYGEITFDQVYQFLAHKFQINVDSTTAPIFEVPERLGTFCEGCPHTASYFAIDRVMKPIQGITGGDIGCSSLPPFRADWLLCMNSGIGISLGISQVSNQPLVSTGGDGSFFHAGILAILNAVQNKINIIHIVFDNRTIAMTGHQLSPSTSINYHILLKSIGVDRVIETYAFKSEQLQKTIEEEMDKDGVRVIWVKGNCAMMPDEVMQERRKTLTPKIDSTKCADCRLCYEKLACPAINLNESTGGFYIESDSCMRCGVCFEICPNEAITVYKNEER